MNLSQRYGLFALAGIFALCGCAPKTLAPAAIMPAPIVQAPDPAVVHRIWQAGYAAGYDEAQRLETRRDEQQLDQLSTVPTRDDSQTQPPALSSPTPVAAGPEPNLFQPIGPATPVSAGD